MKKLLPLLLLVPMSPVLSDIKQEFVTSAQITVDMPFVTTQKVGTTYSLSGNNITPSVTVGDTTTAGKIGGINVGSLSDGVPAMIQTDTTVTSSGSAFSKTESVIMGDATPSFLMTVALRTCTALYKPTTSILSYSIDSLNAINVNLQLIYVVL